MKKEIKAWWNKNKKKVYIAGGIVVGVGAVHLFRKKRGIIRTTKLPKPSCEAEKIANAAYTKIDEAIFTELAPGIEDIVLEAGCSEGYISKVFTIPQPKRGDFVNGLYTDKKIVEVFIRNA